MEGSRGEGGHGPRQSASPITARASRGERSSIGTRGTGLGDAPTHALQPRPSPATKRNTPSVVFFAC